MVSCENCGKYLFDVYFYDEESLTGDNLYEWDGYRFCSKKCAEDYQELLGNEDNLPIKIMEYDDVIELMKSESEWLEDMSDG